MSHTIKTSEHVTWISNSDASGNIEIDTLVTEEGKGIIRFEDIKEYLNYCGYKIEKVKRE